MPELNPMETEIAKRRKEVDAKVREIIDFIVEKGENITLEDKRFLKARYDYLNRAQKQEFAYLLEEDLSKDPDEKDSNGAANPSLDEEMRVDLEKRARAAGVKNPERFKTKQQILDAIASAQLVENK